MGQQWYVRFPDEETGPYSAGELRRLAAEGSVSPDVLVSIDRQRWIKASQVRGLFIPKSKSSPSPTPEAATGVEDDASPDESTPAQEGISASHLEVPREAADKNTESVRAKAKPADSSVINSAKELGARARDYARPDEAKELADRALGQAKQASTSAKEHATDLTGRARDAAVATAPFWERLLHEIREIVGASARQTAMLIGYGCSIARTRTLLCKARGTQLALGNRMYEAGVGDGAIRGQIASLDDRIASVELGKGSTKQMEAEKKGLMIRLAADALAQDVAPTCAAAEHGSAVSARNAVEAQRSRLVSTRTGLAPQDTTSWRRIGLGYGVVMLALAFATTLFLRSASVPTDSNDTAILRDRNHPSIVTWVAFNETWGLGHPEAYKTDRDTQLWVNSMVDAIRKLDPPG